MSALILALLAAAAAAQDSPETLKARGELGGYSLQGQAVPPTAPGKPVLPDFDAELEKLLPALDDDEFPIREKASAALKALAKAYDEEPALRAALKKRLDHPEPEARARLRAVYYLMPVFKFGFDVSARANSWDEHAVYVSVKNISGEDQPYLESAGAPDADSTHVLYLRMKYGLQDSNDIQWLSFYPTRDPELLKRGDAKTLGAGQELILRAKANGRHYRAGMTFSLYLSRLSPGGAELFEWKDGEFRRDGEPPLETWRLKVSELTVEPAKKP